MKALWILLLLAGCASGSTILVGDKRPPLSPDQVKIYTEPPASYDAIAIVKASSDMGWTEQGSVDYALKELKSQAAKVGANGVLFISTGSKATGGGGVANNGFFTGYTYDAQTIEGKAIYVY